MRKILFVGTRQTAAALEKEFKGYAMLVSTEKADICICEITCRADFLKIPNQKLPLFLLMNTKDRMAFEVLKNRPVDGIFFLPLDTGAAKNKIEKVMAREAPLPGLKNADEIKIKILARAENVPALPMFAQRLITLTSDKLGSIKEITEQIKKDQVLSGRVIRMVNTPFYQLRQNISSIDRAIVILGFQTLKNIALVAYTSDYYNKPFHFYSTTGVEMWLHSYMVAMMAEDFAKYMQADQDALFLAGLLHDIGKTIAVDFLDEAVQSCEEEFAQLGTDHAEIGGLMLKSWDIDPEIVNAVRFHHEPGDTPVSQVIYHVNRLLQSGENGKYMLEDELDMALELVPSKYRKKLGDKVSNVLNSMAQRKI